MEYIELLENMKNKSMDELIYIILNSSKSQDILDNIIYQEIKIFTRHQMRLYFDDHIEPMKYFFEDYITLFTYNKPTETHIQNIKNRCIRLDEILKSIMSKINCILIYDIEINQKWNLSYWNTKEGKKLYNKSINHIIKKYTIDNEYKSKNTIEYQDIRKLLYDYLFFL